MLKIKIINRFYKAGLFTARVPSNPPIITRTGIILRALIAEKLRARFTKVAYHQHHIEECERQVQYLIDSWNISECELEELKKELVSSIPNKRLRNALLDIWYFGDIIVYEPNSPEARYNDYIKQVIDDPID